MRAHCGVVELFSLPYWNRLWLAKHEGLLICGSLNNPLRTDTRSGNRMSCGLQQDHGPAQLENHYLAQKNELGNALHSFCPRNNTENSESWPSWFPNFDRPNPSLREPLPNYYTVCEMPSRFLVMALSEQHLSGVLNREVDLVVSGTTLTLPLWRLGRCRVLLRFGNSVDEVSRQVEGIIEFLGNADLLAQRGPAWVDVATTLGRNRARRVLNALFSGSKSGLFVPRADSEGKILAKHLQNLRESELSVSSPKGLSAMDASWKDTLDKALLRLCGKVMFEVMDERESALPALLKGTRYSLPYRSRFASSWFSVGAG